MSDADVKLLPVPDLSQAIGAPSSPSTDVGRSGTESIGEGQGGGDDNGGVLQALKGVSEIVTTQGDMIQKLVDNNFCLSRTGIFYRRILPRYLVRSTK